GTVTLPTWLAATTGTSTTTATGHFEADGDVDLALSSTSVPLAPGNTIRLIPQVKAAPPLLRVVRTGRTGPVTVAVAGRPQLPAPTGSFPLLDVDGSFSSAGAANLDVHFPTGGLNLGGFAIAGGATVHFDGRRASVVPPVFPTVSITVDGTVTVAQTITLA